MNRLLIFLLLILTKNSTAQSVSTDTIGKVAAFENIYNQKLFSDSLSSSFLILIKKEVKQHKHAFHSEQIFVLDGTARMMLADSVFTIKKGDLIFVPKNTSHSVTTISPEPLKVISIQSPFFDGTDRIFAE